MKSKGLGDTIEIITYYTGIKFLVRFLSKVFNTSCECEARKKDLNKLFPYKE